MNRFWFLLVAIAISTSFVGCGSSERASTDPVDEMPADEELTEDPTADSVNP